MAKSQPEITDRLTNCSVCFELYEEKGDHVPRILPCLHSFCERCIRELLDGDTFHCPDCKVPHSAENGVEAFKVNKYVLAHIEKITLDSIDTCAITKKLLQKLKVVKDAFSAKEETLIRSKQEMEDKNLKCKEKLDSEKKKLLKIVRTTFSRMVKEVNNKIKSEIRAMDLRLVEVNKYSNKLNRLEKKLLKKAKGAREDCAVELEQLKNMAELPVRKFQYCEYHPDDDNKTSDSLEKRCGYLSTGQEEFKETFSFSMDKILNHLCVINNEEIVAVRSLMTSNCYDVDVPSDITLSKFNLRSGSEVETVRLKTIPKGIVSISLAGRSCVALSYTEYNEILPNKKWIEFRDVNNLRVKLMTYKPPVKPGRLTVAPPDLLFYVEAPEAEFRGVVLKIKRYSGEVRMLDCSTNPPKPGKKIWQTCQYEAFTDFNFVQQGEKQYLMLAENDSLSAFDMDADKIDWGKSYLGYRDTRLYPKSLTANADGHLLVLNDSTDIQMFCRDGRYMGKLMDLPGAKFIRWIDSTSSLVVAQYEDNYAREKYRTKWKISVFKVQ